MFCTTRTAVARQSSDTNSAFSYRFEHSRRWLLRIRLATTSFAYQPPAYFTIADYVAAGLSFDTRAPSLYITIDRLSGCLERVVAVKLANCAISSQQSFSRHQLQQNDEECTFYPQYSLRALLVSCSVFSSFVARAVVFYPSSRLATRDATVTSQVSTFLVVT